MTGRSDLLRLVVADVLHRALNRLPPPGMPPQPRAGHCTPLILSTNPPAMGEALSRYGVAGVLVLPLPHARAARWHFLSDRIIGAATLVIVDDIGGVASLRARAAAMRFLRAAILPHQCLWVSMAAMRLRATSRLPTDGVHAGIGLDDQGHILVGMRHAVGRRAPQMLIGEIHGGRITWKDPAIIYRREQALAMAWR